MALTDASGANRRSSVYVKATPPHVRLVKRGWKFLSYSLATAKEKAHLPSSSVNSNEFIDGSANSGDNGSSNGRPASGEVPEECIYGPVMEDEHLKSEMSMPDGRPAIQLDLLPLPSYRQDVLKSPLEAPHVNAQSHLTVAVDRRAGKLLKLLINEQIFEASRCTKESTKSEPETVPLSQSCACQQPGTTSSIQKGRFTLAKPKEHAILRTPSGRRKFTFEPSDSSSLTSLEATPTSACGYQEPGVVSAEAHHGQNDPNNTAEHHWSNISLSRSLSTPNPVSQTQPMRCHRRVNTVDIISPILATSAGILEVCPSFRSPSLGVSVAGLPQLSSVSRWAERTMGAAGGYAISEPCRSVNSHEAMCESSTPNYMSQTHPMRCCRRVHTVAVRSPILATSAGILQVCPSFQSPSLGVSVSGLPLSKGLEAMCESKSVHHQFYHQLQGEGQGFVEGGYQRRSICITSSTRRPLDASTISRFRRHTQPSSSKVDGEFEKRSTNAKCALGTGVMEEVVSSSATGRQFTVVRKGGPSPRLEGGGRQLTAGGRAGNLPDVSLANGASAHMFLPTFQSSMSKPGLGCAMTEALPQMYEANSASGATDNGVATDGAVSSIASSTASSISTMRTADSGYAASVHHPQLASWASSPLEEGTSNAQVSTIAQQPTCDVRSVEGAAHPTVTTPKKKSPTSTTSAGNVQQDAFPIEVSSVTAKSTVHGKTGRKFVITREEST